jgi:hypothetical protein
MNFPTTDFTPSFSDFQLDPISVQSGNTFLIVERPRGETASIAGAFSAIESISCSVRDEEGVFIAENAELHIFGNGATGDAAIKDFYSSLKDTWDGLKGHADYQLTEDAIELRDRLARFFEPVCDVKG